MITVLTFINMNGQNRLQVDVRAKAEEWSMTDGHNALTASVGCNFNQKRFLGLEFGFAYGHSMVSDGFGSSSYMSKDYIAVPLDLEYIRYTRGLKVPATRSHLHYFIGAGAGCMLQYASSFKALPFAMLKTGLELRGPGRYRMAFGLELTDSNGTGVFFSFGF